MADRLQIVTWKWGNKPHPKKGLVFGPDHIHIIRNMLKRNLTIPHDIVCITDNPDGLDKDIRVIPIWDDFNDKDGCFVRLRSFSKEMRKVIGSRFASIDIDSVIVGNVDSIFGRAEDFVIWGDEQRGTRYCGSLFMMNAGARDEQVWKTFNPDNYTHTRITNGVKVYREGTDQFHISTHLKNSAEFSTILDGIYDFKAHIRIYDNRPAVTIRTRLDMVRHQLENTKDESVKLRLENLLKEFEKELVAVKCGKPIKDKPPINAKIVFFNGQHDPSHLDLQKEYPWVKEYWQ